MAKPPEKRRKVGWLEAWRGGYLRYPSVIVLIAANLVPLFGVLFWGWDLFVLMMAYWAETGVIGFWAILHMALVARWRAIFYVPFFIIHFGGFMLGHFLFLFVMFGDPHAFKPNNLEEAPQFVLNMLTRHGLWIALIALFVSHGLSFFFNVLRPLWRGEAEPTTEGNVMGSVYGRVVVMHITILIGAALAAWFKTKTAAFVLLIALKIFVDVSAHIRKNFKPDGGEAGRMPAA
jgi:hypothetical protein